MKAEGAPKVKIKVQGYSGFKLNERPSRFTLDDREYQVQEILDQWYGPDEVYFKARANDGNDYILSYNSLTDEWRLESFRRPSGGLQV